MFPIIKHFVKEFYNPEKDRTQSVIALAFCGTLLILQRASLLRCTKPLILYYLKKKMNSQLMNHLTIFPVLLYFFVCNSKYNQGTKGPPSQQSKAN